MLRNRRPLFVYTTTPFRAILLLSLILINLFFLKEMFEARHATRTTRRQVLFRFAEVNGDQDQFVAAMRPTNLQDVSSSSSHLKQKKPTKTFFPSPFLILHSNLSVPDRLILRTIS
jgi:hypothetical protein